MALSPHIALIGCGNMGKSILKAWLNKFSDSYSYTLITRKKRGVVDFLKYSNITWTEAGKPLDKVPDIILIAVKPQQLDVALAPYSAYKECLYISIVAGRMTKSYKKYLPTQKFIRLMPNMPAAVEEGITSAYTKSKLTASEKKKIDELLQAFGQVAWLEVESHFHAATALAGSGPAYVFLFTETLVEAGISQGLPQELAQKLARQTLVGSAAYLGASHESLETLRDQVTSPGGTTEAALKVLTRSLPSLMKKAIEKATERSKELS